MLDKKSIILRQKKSDFISVSIRLIYYLPSDEYRDFTKYILSILDAGSFSLDRVVHISMSEEVVAKEEKRFDKFIALFGSLTSSIVSLLAEDSDPLDNMLNYKRYYSTLLSKYFYLLSDDKLDLVITAIKNTSWYNVNMSKDTLLPILKHETFLSAFNFSLFGSFSRGEEKDNSDIDILHYISNKDKPLYYERMKYFQRNLEIKTGRVVNLCNSTSFPKYKKGFLDRISKDVIHFASLSEDFAFLDNYFNLFFESKEIQNQSNNE